MTTIEARREAFDLGRVVSRTFGAVGRNFATFLVLAILLVGVPQFVMGWLTFPALSRLTTAGAANAAAIASYFTSPWLALTLITWPLMALFKAAVIHRVVADLNGRRSTIRECLSSGLPLVLPLMAINILYSLGAALGMILLIVPGFILAMTWIVAAPAEIIERTGVFAAFTRSGELTRGSRWSIFGLMFAYSLVVGIVQQTITSVMALARNTNHLTPGLSLPSVLVLAVFGAATSTLATTGVAAIYYELRSIREGAAPGVLAEVFD
jgi:hypothetical protein